MLAATGAMTGTERAAYWCAFGSAAAAVVSIAVSQSLLGLAVALLLLSGARLRLPPIVWPLAAFIGWTLLSLALSPDPWLGRPQIRKLFVYLTLLTVFSLLRGAADVRRLWLVWATLGSASAALGLYQFAAKWRAAAAAGRDFYVAYVADRITGFMSHWMTFSGIEMLALLAALALLLFDPVSRRTRSLLAAAVALMGLAILLGLTRGVWVGAAVGGVYLFTAWRRWALAAVPVLLVVAYAAAPSAIRDRVNSFVRPQGQLDSNQHRIVTWRTGVRMIAAHPWFGVGPEMVGRNFDEFVPADVGRPLPSGWYGHLHNIYLQFAAERGIPALLAILWLFGVALWDWFRALRGRRGARWALHGAIAAMLAMLVTGLFEHNLGDSEVLAMTWAMLCCGYLARGEAPGDQPA